MKNSLSIHRDIRGFSLIEMMVAVTIGLLLLAGLGTVYLGSRQTFRQQEALARMQEGARYAFEAMTLDLRQAGYIGCAPRNQIYSTLVVSTPPDWFNDLATRPLFGYESGAGLPAVVTGELANTDALMVLRADDSGNYRVQNHNGPSAQFQLFNTHDLTQGEVLTVVPTNCGQAITFQMTNVNNNNTVSTVVHNTGNAVTPGNSTGCLGNPSSPSCTGGPGGFPSLPTDSKIMRMIGRIYYLENNGNNQPALFREILTSSGGSAAEELIEGVEDMQITYGVDTSSPATCSQTDGVVDAYVDADAVIATAPCATLEDDWSKVLSVRITLLMRSVENSVVNQPQAVLFNGATVNSGAGADRRLRKVFTTTIAVRNRL